MSTVLGIECSGASLSVAILKDAETLAYKLITAPSGYPEILVPTINEVMQEAHLNYADIDLIAAGRGPGSFTGERIALATASAIAMAADKKAVGIDGFTAAAFMIDENIRKSADMIIVAIETRRDDFYIACFNHDLKLITEPASLPADKINPKGNVVIAGDAASRLVSLLPSFAANINIADNTTPDAVVMAKYALLHPDLDMPLTPLYISPAHVTCPTGK